ncbi:MAG: cation transporting ATPase C-terminal domain-containing protein [Gloeobacterales cyanobacterium]
MPYGIQDWLINANPEEPPEQFRTGWFLESVISAALVVLVVRTRQFILNSKPGKYLLVATLVTVGVTIIIPWTPFGTLLGFQPLPFQFERVSNVEVCGKSLENCLTLKTVSHILDGSLSW